MPSSVQHRVHLTSICINNPSPHVTSMTPQHASTHTTSSHPHDTDTTLMASMDRLLLDCRHSFVPSLLSPLHLDGAFGSGQFEIAAVLAPLLNHQVLAPLLHHQHLFSHPSTNSSSPLHILDGAFGSGQFKIAAATTQSSTHLHHPPHTDR